MPTNVRQLCERLLEPIDRALIAANSAGRGAPIFVIGAPRSGTTIVGQYLTAGIHCGYFSNLDRRHAGWPALSATIHRSADHFVSSFANHRGSIEGDHAPSDGWELFQRFFPPMHDPASASKSRTGLEGIVKFYEALYDAPLLVKNNANTLRLIELDQTFDDACFVHVRRPLVPTVLSLLEVRRDLGVAVDEFWSCGPAARFVPVEFHDEIETAVFQCGVIERYVECARTRLDVRRFVAVDYDEFVATPRNTLESLIETAVWAPRRATDLDAANAAVARGAARSPDSAVVTRIEAASERLDAAVGECVAALMSEYPVHAAGETVATR